MLSLLVRDKRVNCLIELKGTGNRFILMDDRKADEYVHMIVFISMIDN